MRETFLIGVDGGGTRTRARVVAADGRVVGHGDAGPSGLSQGIEQAWANVQAAIADALDHNLAAVEDCLVGLALAGAHDDAQRSAFVAAAPRWLPFVVDTDSHAALLGAHRGAPGCVVIVGTGSVGEALDPDGRRSVCGGWGYPAGDEGSGAWLGLRAMAIAQRALDGRAAAGALARAVWRYAGDDVATLRAWCICAGQQRYAELAPLVFDHEAADPTAAHLIERVIAEVAALADALDPEGRLPFAVTGSIGRRLAQRLPAALLARHVEPAGGPLDGAIELARRALGWPPGVPAAPSAA